MKLTKEQVKKLMEWGYPEEDMEQIERALKKTVYKCDGKKISRKKAIELLGMEPF